MHSAFRSVANHCSFSRQPATTTVPTVSTGIAFDAVGFASELLFYLFHLAVFPAPNLSAFHGWSYFKEQDITAF